MISLLECVYDQLIVFRIINNQVDKPLNDECDGLAFLTRNNDLRAFLKMLILQEVLHLVKELFGKFLFIKILDLL